MKASKLLSPESILNTSSVLQQSMYKYEYKYKYINTSVRQSGKKNWRLEVDGRKIYPSFCIKGINIF